MDVAISSAQQGIDERKQEDETGARARRRRKVHVVLAVLAALIGALVLRGCLPVLLPADIAEGPMMQQVTADSAIVVWWTTKEAACEFEYGLEGQSMAPAEVRMIGESCRVALTGLVPAARYNYRVRRGATELIEATFQTAKPAVSAFRFAVLGDSGRATRAQFQVAARIAGAGADFVVHTGDVVYPAGERFNYAPRFFAPNADFLKSIAIWPCLGNHDAAQAGGGGDPYREVFELPHNGPEGQPAENNYWFDYADARFVVLDSNQSEAVMRDSLAPWLTSVLTAPDAKRWRFVVFHHPPYTGGKHSPSETVQRALVPAFEAAGVQVVFSGHDHMYERTHPLRGGAVVEPGQGLIYIVSGAGGAELYEAKPDRPEYVAVLRNQVHSFSLVEVDGENLRFRQLDVSGAVLDEWTMNLPAAP